MKILSVLRSVYLYLALTIAGTAIAVAAVNLIAPALELAGVSSTPPTAESIRQRVSFAAALLLFALPVCAIHLGLIVRSLRDPAERIDSARHFFLNAWIVAGLTTAVIAISAMAEAAIARHSLDLATQLAALIVAVVAVLIGWRWRRATPGAGRVWQVIGAFATLGIATLLGLAAVYEVMGTLGTSYPSVFELGSAPPRQTWAGLVTLAAALLMWGIGLRWQWTWRDVTFRTGYAAAGFGIGLAWLFFPGTDELARLIAVARGSMGMTDVARFWSDPAAGAFLVALHLPWLVVDRSRAALPARVTDRLIRGIGALVGLVDLFMAWAAAWMYLAQDVLRLGPPPPPPIFVDQFAPKPIGNDNEAIAAAILGLALFVPAWWGFLRSTAGDVRSSLRRAYVLVAVTLSLTATIVTGAISAYNAISLALGAEVTDPLIRTAIDTGGIALGAGLILGAHLWLLMRDVGASRALPAVVATVRPQADPLLALLRDVAAGRLAPEAAATRIRAGLLPGRGAPPGRTA